MTTRDERIRRLAEIRRAQELTRRNTVWRRCWMCLRAIVCERDAPPVCEKCKQHLIEAYER